MVNKAITKKAMRQFTPKRTAIGKMGGQPLELPNFSKGKAPESDKDLANKKYVDDSITPHTPEGTAVKSTGEGGGTKFLREDGDNTCSWQTAGGAAAPTGSIIMFGAAAAPAGWLLCNGAEVSQATYATLYAVLGADAFGTDAGGNFFLPNLVQKFPRGIGTIGATGGSDDAIVVTHDHGGATDNQSASHAHNTVIGSHTHTISLSTGGGAFPRFTITNDSSAPDVGRFVFGNIARSEDLGTKGSGNQTASHNHAITSAGAAGGDANMPAYLEVNFIIKT